MSQTTSPQQALFPNESAEYRSQRDTLLRAEADLRDRVESVAALRRTLPLGGTVPTDYLFHEGEADLNDHTTREYARGRAWTHLRRLSSSENGFNRDHGGESADGHQTVPLTRAR